ncbi:Hypothetical predicted protein, partial [Paramuricea clavata]
NDEEKILVDDGEKGNDEESEIEGEEEILVDDGTLNKGMLFVYQTQWQKLKTNVEYKVVATFVTQSETTEAIKEALSVIMKWNPSWKPKHFMVDYALEEISSVEQLFPEKVPAVTILLYKKYQIKCRGLWRKFNNIPVTLRESLENIFESSVIKSFESVGNLRTAYKLTLVNYVIMLEKALAAMRKIARARTETEFLKEVESLKQDEDLWSNSMYKKYMENMWLKEHKQRAPIKTPESTLSKETSCKLVQLILFKLRAF